jgi:hypothetical protein
MPGGGIILTAGAPGAGMGTGGSMPGCPIAARGGTAAAPCGNCCACAGCPCARASWWRSAAFSAASADTMPADRYMHCVSGDKHNTSLHLRCKGVHAQGVQASASRELVEALGGVKRISPHDFFLVFLCLMHVNNHFSACHLVLPC